MYNSHQLKPPFSPSHLSHLPSSFAPLSPIFSLPSPHPLFSPPALSQGVIKLIFTKAVDEPTFCPMYAALCEKLSRVLPELPPSNGAGGEEGGAGEGRGEPISFRCVLLNTCQEEFERAVKLQAGELLESLQEGSTEGEEGGEDGGGEERREEERGKVNGGEQEGGEGKGVEEGGEEEGGEEMGEEGGKVDWRKREGEEGRGVKEIGEGEGEGKGAKKRGRKRGGRKRKGKGENCTKEVQGERGERGEDEGEKEGDEEGGREGEKDTNEDDEREKREKERESEKAGEEEKEQRRAKARTVGTFRLIGELFLQKMIPEPVVHACVQVSGLISCALVSRSCWLTQHLSLLLMQKQCVCAAHDCEGGDGEEWESATTVLLGDPPSIPPPSHVEAVCVLLTIARGAMERSGRVPLLLEGPFGRSSVHSPSLPRRSSVCAAHDSRGGDGEEWESAAAAGRVF
ncbi:unnamed protein product [Closterium sp. Naga37s-1]|nr:unnamed protein product [Closterium sp. Naga37s-1]